MTAENERQPVRSWPTLKAWPVRNLRKLQQCPGDRSKDKDYRLNT